MESKFRQDLVKIKHRDLSEELAVHEIPLPSEVPSPVDLSELPENILKSNTMEMLIQQNEDLMARLSVNLRRNSNLENRLEQRDTENRNLALEVSKLSDQILIYQSKDGSWKDRITKAENLQKEAEQDLQLTQIKLKELEKDSQWQITQLEGTLQKTKKRLKLLARYHQRIQKFVRPLVREQQSRLKLQIDRVRDLENKVMDREMRYTAVQERMAEMIDRIKAQAENHQNDITLLSERLQGELRSKDSEIQQLKATIRNLEQKSKLADLLSEQKIEWENRLIRLERQRDEVKERMEQEVNSSKHQLLEAKTTNGQLRIDNESLQKALLQVRAEFNQIKEEFSALNEQKENLQLMWLENRKYVEELEIKGQALQRLNQDLSARLNSMRRQLEQQTAASQSERLGSDLEVRALKEEVALARREINTLAPVPPTSEEPLPGPLAAPIVATEPQAEPNVDANADSKPIAVPIKVNIDRAHQEKMLERIEHLLSEIEVGMGSTHKNLHFIENEEALDTDHRNDLPSLATGQAPAQVPPIESSKEGMAQLPPQKSLEDERAPITIEDDDTDIFVHSAVDQAFERIEERRRDRQMPEILENGEPISLAALTVPDESSSEETRRDTDPLQSTHRP